MRKPLRLLLALCILVSFSGCAIGRTTDGSLVVGAKVGDIAEVVAPVIATGINMLVPGLGTAVVGIGSSIAVALRMSNKRKRADMRRETAERTVAVLEERNLNGSLIS